MAFTTAGCGGLGCGGDPSATTVFPAPAAPTTSIIVWTTGGTSPNGGAPSTGGTASAGTTAPGLPTTATSLATTTTEPVTTTEPPTTTTLNPVDQYKAEMRQWKDAYAPGMQESYQVISKMSNPFSPSDAEIEAASRLDTQLQLMVEGLRAIEPPAQLAQVHADYLASLESLAAGAHDLAVAMRDKKGLQTVSAIASIATAWSDGEAARTAMEQALGFSLSSTE